MDSYIRILADAELKKKAKKYAKEKGMNLSALIRVLLINEMYKDNK